MQFAPSQISGLGLIIFNWNQVKQNKCGIRRIVVIEKTRVLRLVNIVYRE